MPRRRFLVSASLLGTGAFALPIPSGEYVHFRVFRNGSPIGEQHLTFRQSGNSLTVNIVGELVVTFATIPIFHYSVNATEYWENGVFQSIESAVNYNGSPLQVQAERTSNGYQVRGTHVPLYTAPLDTLPLTYWNKAMLDGTILNIQTAHSYKVKVVSPGWSKLPTANGGSLIARRFNLSGKLNLSIWYDQNNAWSGLEFHRDGDITYEKYTG